MTTVERVAQAIRRNPEGLLLLGAGVALMLRNAATANSTKPPRKRSVRPAADRYYDGAGNGSADTAEGLASKVSAAADDVRNYVSETAQDLSDKASEYGEAASRRTREAADSAYRSTREAADSAYRSVESAIEAHPVSLAIAGLAAGCLAAAVFPSTRFERATLGPIGRRAAEAASETGELVKTAAVARVTKAALKAGEQLKDAVTERRLNTDNLGEVARDVASDFTNNVAGGSESKTGSQQTGSRQTDSRMAKAQL
jgi:histone H3/H4